MASTAAEARDMLAVSRAHPDLVCQLTPTSTSYTIDNVLKRLIDDGHLGELLSVDFTSLQNNFADFDGPLHWRHDRSLSGYNTLNIGASYESMMRWLGRGDRVFAMSQGETCPTEGTRMVIRPRSPFPTTLISCTSWPTEPRST